MNRYDTGKIGRLRCQLRRGRSHADGAGAASVNGQVGNPNPGERGGSDCYPAIAVAAAGELR